MYRAHTYLCSSLLPHVQEQPHSIEPQFVLSGRVSYNVEGPKGRREGGNTYRRVGDESYHKEGRED